MRGRPDIVVFNLIPLIPAVPNFLLYNSDECISLDDSDGLSIAVDHWKPIVLRIREVVPDLLD